MISFCRHSIKKQPHTSISYFKIVFFVRLFVFASKWFVLSEYQQKQAYISFGWLQKFFFFRTSAKTSNKTSLCQVFLLFKMLCFVRMSTETNIYLFLCASKYYVRSECHKSKSISVLVCFKNFFFVRVLTKTKYVSVFVCLKILFCQNINKNETCINFSYPSKGCVLLECQHKRHKKLSSLKHHWTKL